jgi:hypothetical protein
VGEISVKTGNNARNGGKNSLNRLIRWVLREKKLKDTFNFNKASQLGKK